MIKGDIGDDGGDGVDGIGCIQSAAHAGLPDDHIAVVSGKNHHCQNRGKFKIAEISARGSGGEFGTGGVEFTAGNNFAVDAESFPHVDEMG